jgi:hypothetical protein
MRILILLFAALSATAQTIPAVTLTVPGCTVPAQTITTPKNGGKVTIPGYTCPAQKITILAYTIPVPPPATYGFTCTAPVVKADGTPDMTQLSCTARKQ